jgi:hypothetical protein
VVLNQNDAMSQRGFILRQDVGNVKHRTELFGTRENIDKRSKAVEVSGTK